MGLKQTWELWKLYRRRDEMFKKLRSRKLWVTVAAVALVSLLNQLGVDDQLTQKIVTLAQTYVIGQGVVDVATVVKK